MIELAIQSYGPIAFGLVSVIILWRVIIAPELELQRAGIQELAKITNATVSTAEKCKDATERAENIAQILAATCPRSQGAATDENLQRQSQLRTINAHLAT